MHEYVKTSTNINSWINTEKSEENLAYQKIYVITKTAARVALRNYKSNSVQDVKGTKKPAKIITT